jgi:hypothetical protein
MTNEYKILGEKLNEQGTAKVLMYAKEESNILNRACCAPNHALKVKFHMPDPNNNKKPSKNPEDVVWTMERDGCCTKWLNCCCPLTGCCQQDMKLWAGNMEEDIGKITGQLIGRAMVPKPFGGCLTPTLHIMERDATEPGAKLEGPTLFGGCTELCFTTEWPISKFASEKKAGDLAMIQKMKPDTFTDAMKELLGDADTYRMSVSPGMSADQKAVFLASLLLLDYMFFERDSDMIKFENGCQTLTINCFMLYCCGVLCPCTCTLDARKDKDGDGIPDN